MRKDIFRIAAAVLSFAAVSCTNDMIDNGGEVNQDGNLVPMILTSGPSVRTSLNGSSVNWTADDVVAVYRELSESASHSKDINIVKDRIRKALKVKLFFLLK